ncbi:YtzI protein [Virgibacillus byunsanensis]|uniref:YtzI protein n=1 Tax=Virgibacillus byunsanensis TaxID=570945 RepID=A0ABW3LKW9_9BACI
MLFYIILSIAIMLVVLLLSLFTISKGYAYKHTVDPLPDEQEDKNDTDIKENY